MKRWLGTILVGLTVLAPSTARAGTAVCSFGSTNPFGNVTVPTVNVCLNGTLFTFTGFIGNGKPSTFAGAGGVGGVSFIITANVNADPFASFSFASTLPGGFGPVSFDVFVTTPVVAGPYNSASSAGTLSVTATGTTTSGTVTAGSAPTYLSGFGNATSLGVNSGTGTCTVSTPPTPNSKICNPPGGSNTFAPINPATLTAHVSYTQTTVGTGSSRADWTGIVNLTTTATVPEPSTVALVFAGMLLIGGARLRRNRG